jgi:hypothetical protein
MTNSQEYTHQELEIINRMRGKVMGRNENSGVNLFMVWGYPTVLVFLLEFAALMILHKHWYEWLWVGIPLLGVPLMVHFQRKDYERTGHRTLDSNVALQMWIYIGAASAFLGFFTGIAGVYPVCYCFIQGLLIGMGSFLTGIISRFRPMTTCGIIGSVLSFACLFLQGDLWPWQFLIVSVISVIALIIPGHLIFRYVKQFNSFNS